VRTTAIETWHDFLLSSHTADTKGDAVPRHDMKAYVTVDIQLLSLLSSVKCLTRWQLYLPGKSHRYLLTGRLGGPQWRFQGEIKLSRLQKPVGLCIRKERPLVLTAIGKT